jgi:thiol-disulfide isomerase/thioredoxin
MDTILLIVRLLLATVFSVAGLAKLADRAGSRQALIDFGVPAVLATPFGILLPLTELVLAVTLLPSTSAWWGAVGALVLLLLFVSGIGINLARGRKPACHCFGQFYSAPAGWPTLARNGVLAAMAGFVVWQGRANVGPSAVSWLAPLTTTEILGLIVTTTVLGLLAAEGWFLFHLLRQNGRLLLRIEALEKMLNSDDTSHPPTPALPAAGLPLGTPAPAFQLAGLYGETLTLDALRSNSKPLMLIFTDPGCGPCNALMPEIAPWQRDHVSKLTIALISRGTIEANRLKNNEHSLTHILLQRDREIAESYRAYGTPSAVIVRPDGTIGSPLAAGADTIRALVAQTVGLPTPLQPSTMALPTATGGCGCGNGNGNGHSNPMTPTLQATKIGEPAPVLKLPDLSGKSIDLASFRGHETLVLFWNPNCGFCRKMLNDLKAWEANAPREVPKLLVVSTGTVDENQAMGLRSPVVLDQSFSMGQAFGANGTPSAVLVDAMGNIASGLAVGASAILALNQASTRKDKT